MASESEYDASESEYESSESDYDSPPLIPNESESPPPIQAEPEPPADPAARSEPGLVIHDGSEASMRSQYAATIREAMESAAALRRAMQSAAVVFRGGSESAPSSESAEPVREGSESPTISELAAAIRVAMESIVAIRGDAESVPNQDSGGEAESVTNPDSGTGTDSSVTELTAAIREALVGATDSSVATGVNHEGSQSTSMARLQQFLVDSSQTRGLRFFPILVARIGSPLAAADNESPPVDRVLVINPIGRSFVILQGEAAQLLMQGSGGRAGTPPASKEAIEALRTVENGEVEEEMECPVCMDEYGEKKVVKEMPCKHLFHEGCIEKWLRIKGSCPVCRFQMAGDGASDGGEEHGRGIGMTVTEQGVSMSLAMVASVRREDSNGESGMSR